MKKPEPKSPNAQISALQNMKLRTNLNNGNFANYHSALHSAEPEIQSDLSARVNSVGGNPCILTQPQKAQISESFNCYLATKNSVNQNKRKQDSRSGSLTHVNQGGSYFKQRLSPTSSPTELQPQLQPTISFA